MPKIAMITDTHFGCRNDNKALHQYFEKSFKWFFNELESRGIRSIYHLGDLYDRRKYINFLTASKSREYFLDEIDRKQYQCHIITGNHDIYWKNTSEINALDELVSGRYNTIFTYKDATEIPIAPGLDVLLVPWITPENNVRTHDMIRSTKAEIVMGHLELDGFEMFKGMVSDHGEDKSIYDKFDLVFSGHYHHKSSKGNIHYIGAFAEYIWSDYKDPRGFTIFDTDTREFEFIQNPYSIFNIVFYDDEKEKNIMKKIKNTDYSKYTDTFVKVICSTRNDPYAFDLLIEKIHASSPIDVSIVEDMNILIGSDDEELDQTQDTPTILSGYIKSLTLPVDNDKMIAYMKEIYKEALTQEYID